MKLTKKAVEAVPPPDRSASFFWDDDLRGFGLRVTPTGVRSYIVQGRVNGKTRRVTLGRHGVLTAEQARRKAQSKLGEMADGRDHSAERKRDKALGVTLRDVMDSYLRDRRKLKPRTRADIRYHLDKSFETWADRAVAAITRDKVARRFRELSDRSPAQANQAFRVLRGLLNYARARYRTPDDLPILPENPVDVLSEGRMWNASKARNQYVPLERAGEWWAAVQALREDPALTRASQAAADLVAVLTLTGLRLGEARTLTWDQVDLADRSVTLPDTKNRTDIRLPLSEVATAILEDRPQRSSWVFPARSGKGPLSDCRATLQKLQAATGIEVTAHDLRRTFRAIAGRVGIELWRTKALMNHAQTADITLAHYTDLEDVRYLRSEADSIGEWLEQQRQIADGANVVTFEHSGRNRDLEGTGK